MKIDIEGGEETAPLPFLETAPEELQPRLLIIEDNPEGWSGGLMAALETRGWAKKGLSTNNLILEPPGGN